MTAGGGSKGGFTMQSLQAKHQVQVAQSNKHHPCLPFPFLAQSD